MKIKEVQAGVKVTKDYNSYQASLSAEISSEENPESVGAELMEKALTIVNRKAAELERNKLGRKDDEMGAAWLGKKSGVLSVQYSDGTWKDVNVSGLEKTDDGYLQKTETEVFVFKKIPEEKRMNKKMPIYRIYRRGK